MCINIHNFVIKILKLILNIKDVKTKEKEKITSIENNDLKETIEKEDNGNI